MHNDLCTSVVNKSSFVKQVGSTRQ